MYKRQYDPSPGSSTPVQPAVLRHRLAQSTGGCGGKTKTSTSRLRSPQKQLVPWGRGQKSCVQLRTVGGYGGRGGGRG
eukprot:5559359-Prymnesium_polylepis.1